jgi:hypothetical protein
MSELLRRIDFGNEAGDDADPEELVTYFVEQEKFKGFIDPRKRILVATAKKGVGKSALIQWASFMLEKGDEEALVIKCRGADLARSKFGVSGDLKTPNDHIRDWMVRICTLVNRELALRLNLALTDDKITLIESAELDGYKSRNLIGCLLDRFQKFLDSANPTKLHAKDEVQLFKRLKARRVWILIDDLDATFQKTDAESLELGTFFSACRYLIQDVKDINIRVTMRTDVWPVIRRFDEAQDKTEQYIFEILWRQSDFRRLLFRRIKAEVERLNLQLSNPPSHVSEEEIEEYLLKMVFVPRMLWGTAALGNQREVATYKVIYTLSYERPRWAIQLCKLAQARALDRGETHISKEHIDDVWGEYGSKRIADLVAEHKHQCRDVEQLLNAFRGANRVFSRADLFKWINDHVSNHLTPVIDGRTAKSPREIGNFLYRIGFIVARSEEPSGEYEHYSFDQMPDFLTSKTNEDFGVKWEIHPCYREALDIKKVNRSHRARFIGMRGGRR